MLVTVLMPVYNAEKYLSDTIKSILNQTYSSFEFLIINDGSTDNSVDIIRSFKDSRIKLVHNDKNRGIIYSLNRGIRDARCTYLVRIDSDDICLPHRIERQVEFMESNLDIVVAGCNIEMFIDAMPFFSKKTNLPTKHEEIKAKLLFESCLMHPSVIMRRLFFDKYDLSYNEKHKSAEDYGLWQKICFNGKLSNISEVLIKYRVISTSITAVANRNIGERVKILKLIFCEGINNMGIPYTERELDVHAEIALASVIDKPVYTLVDKRIWLEKLKEYNDSNLIYDGISLNKELADQYYKSCLYFGDYLNYRNSIFYAMIQHSVYEYVKQKITIQSKKILTKGFR